MLFAQVPVVLPPPIPGSVAVSAQVAHGHQIRTYRRRSSAEEGREEREKPLKDESGGETRGRPDFFREFPEASADEGRLIFGVLERSEEVPRR
jgi:hypothetical protein